MDKQLFELVSQSLPAFNDAIVDGLAVHQLKFVEAYVDRIMRTAEVDFPPELKYLGFKRCTPQEEFTEITRRLSSQSTFELAPSDLFMVKYFFSFKGEELEPQCIYLPFVMPGGLIRIRGSLFNISPVLADKAISVGTDSIFIPLNRDKLTFERQTQHFYRDGERETVYVIYSLIYHQSAAIKKAANRAFVKGDTTLGHYLFAKYGVTRTFAEFANTTIHVGLEDTINAIDYPKEEWVICSSIQIKPRKVREKFYTPSNIRLAIPRANYNLTTASLIGSFFYIVDLFPNRVHPEYIDEQRLWMVLMGHLLFGNEVGEGKLYEDIAAHLKSMDGHLDIESKKNLQEDGVYCEDLYGLMMHIIETFSHRVTQSSFQVASLYDKRLMVLRYVLYNLIKAINNFMFKVTSSKKTPLLKADILKLMRFTLKHDLVMGINRKHGEVSSASSPGDNKYFKITSQVVLQTDSSGGRGNPVTASNDPGKLLSASIAEVGSFSTMSKSEPTGRNKINPFVKVNLSDGLILRNPETKLLLDSVQNQLQKKI